MKAIAHLMAKDLRRFWPLIALSSAVFAGSLLRDYFGLRWSVRGDNFEDVLPLLLLWPLVFIFTVSLVQEDTPAGHQSFWLTRPIWPGQLLCAKLALLVLSLVLPFALGHFIFSRAIGAAPSLAAFVALEALLLMLLVTTAAALIGALTRSILQACALVAVLFFATFCIVSLSDAPGLRWMRFLAAQPSLQVSYASQFLAVITMAIIGGVACLFVHYRRRALRVTVPIIVGVVLVTLIASSHWPVELLPKAVAVTPPAPLRETPLDLVVTPHNPAEFTGLVREFARSRGTVMTVRRTLLRTTFAQPTANRFFEVSGVESTVRFPDGRELTSQPQRMPYWNRQAIDSWLRASLGVRSNQPFEQTIPVSVFNLSQTEAMSDFPAGTTLTSKLLLTEYVSEREATLPFRRGASGLLTDGSAIVLDSTLQFREPDKTTGVSLRFRLLNATSIFARRPVDRPDLLITQAPGLYNRHFVLYNRRANEFAIGSTSQSRTYNTSFANTYAGSIRFTRRLRADSPTPLTNVDGAWLADAELWVIRRVPARTFEYTLTVPDFRAIVPENALPYEAPN